MKKYYFLIIVVLILGLVLTGCSLLSDIGQAPATEQLKVKPAWNLAGAEEVAWNLSAAVMPVPPYGSADILGSDKESKLIVNQPNGNTEVTITGVMNGLTPNTTYTVILSNGYTPYVYTGWNITGGWTFIAEYGSGKYKHTYNITQDSTGNFTGTGSYETIYGTVDPFLGTIILFHSDYSNGYYWYEATGTIDPTTGAISGTWGNDSQGYGHPWYSISGNAVETHTGDTGHPGDFNYYPRFTFLTDADGAGSWHLNLRDEDFDGAGNYTLSVWINVNEPWKTILISDNFTVKVVY